MSKERDLVGGLIEFFKMLFEGVHPGFVLLASSLVEGALESAILTKMRPLSNNFKSRLFEGYGPLSSFSAKIDVAYALSVIDDQLFADLKVIKELRNEFAHPQQDSMVSFNDAIVTSICKKFSGYEGDNAKIFMVKIANCFEHFGIQSEAVETVKRGLTQSYD